MDYLRVEVERWTRQTDEIFQQCCLEDLSDCVKAVAKAKGPRQQTYTLVLGPRVVEITFRRVQ